MGLGILRGYTLSCALACKHCSKHRWVHSRHRLWGPRGCLTCSFHLHDRRHGTLNTIWTLETFLYVRQVKNLLQRRGFIDHLLDVGVLLHHISHEIWTVDQFHNLGVFKHLLKHLRREICGHARWGLQAGGKLGQFAIRRHLKFLIGVLAKFRLISPIGGSCGGRLNNLRLD